MGPSKAALTTSPAGLPWLLPSFRPPEAEAQVAVCRKYVQGGADHPKISNASILRAIANPNSNPRQVISLFTAAARRRSFRHDLPTFASLLPFLVRHRRIRVAEILLRRLPLTGQRPGPSLLLPLASAALRGGIPHDCAARLLLSARPSDSAFSSLLRALRRSGNLSLARSLILSAVPDDLGFKIKIRHFASFVREHCHQGDAGEAEDLVLLMGQKGVAADTETCNALLAAVCNHNSADDGFRIFLAMVEAGISPDVITFSTMMDWMGKEGRVLGCNGLFGKMLAMGTPPDLPCYRILIGVYCKNGLLNEVVRVLKAMKSDGFLDDLGIGKKSVLECDTECEEMVLCFVLKSGIIGGFMS